MQSKSMFPLPPLCLSYLTDLVFLFLPFSWGRILAATGSLPLSTALNPSAVSVSFIPVPPSVPAPTTFNSTPLALLVNGEPENVDEERAKEIVSQGDLEIRVELGMGKESAKYWTCDFSYVRIFFSSFFSFAVFGRPF